jgi:hypothetical protein
MKPKKITYEDLMEAFPKKLKKCSFEINEGWYEIIWDLCEQLSHNKDIYFRQIKEKFGSMRIYAALYSDEDYELISEACKRSQTTCERCGQPGSIVDSEWRYVACGKHILQRDLEKI